MIITTAQLDEKSAVLPEGQGTQSLPAHSMQIFYAAMPEPSVPVDALGRLSLGDGDLPPAYEAIPVGASADVTLRERPLSLSGNEKQKSHDTTASNDRNLPSSPTYPLDNAPPSFARAVPPTLSWSNPNESTSQHFPPLVLHSKGKKLEEGFYLIPPPTDVQPHPFARHDVNEMDWTKFLTDLQTSARLAVTDQRPTPGRSSSSFFGSFYRSMTSTSLGKQRDDGAHAGPGALVDAWNKHFFNLRGLDVVLAKGGRRLNGDKTLPPPDSITPSDQGFPTRGVPGSDVQGLGSGSSAFAAMGAGWRGRGANWGCYGRGRGFGGWGRGCGRRPAAGWAAGFGQTPVNSAIPPMGPMNLETRRARSLSISSVSSASSESSRDEAIQNIHAPSAFNARTASIAGHCRSRAERKAARLARRMARKERRARRKEARFLRKLNRLNTHLIARGPALGLSRRGGIGEGIGRGIGAGVGAGFGAGAACTNVALGVSPLLELVEMGQRMLRGNAVDDDGYYRLVVSDIGAVH